MDLVSIIVPAYNVEDKIEISIVSLLKQTYSNIEIIIINDGSTDATEKLCNDIAKKDIRVRVKTTKNQGVSAARNLAITLCKGKYITFVDADDYVDKDFIDSLLNEFTSKIDLVCCGYNVISKKTNHKFTQIPERKMYSIKNYPYAINDLENTKCFNSLWNKMFRRSIIIDNNIKMDINIKMGEDFLFILDYLKCILGEISVIDSAKYNYVLTPGGLQSSFEGNPNLRLSQLEELRKFYLEKKYSINSFHIEAIRIYYIIILESMRTSVLCREIFNSNTFKEIRINKKQTPLKSRVFWRLLKTENIFFITLMIRLFNLKNKVLGKEFKW